MIDEDPRGRDPHVLLFGDDLEDDLAYDPDGGHDGFGDHVYDYDYFRRRFDTTGSIGLATESRSVVRRQQRARRRNRHRAIFALLLVLLSVVAAAAWVFARPLFVDEPAADYAGNGNDAVTVKVATGEGAAAIGRTLRSADVVASVAAFTSAAAADDRSLLIQPGSYVLRTRMSGKAALALMLDPSSRRVNRVTIPEGANILGVRERLAKALNLPLAAVTAATEDLQNLGLPVSYAGSGSPAPTSAEGFLFPSTYEFDPGTNALDALQAMTAQFTLHDRDLDFATSADALKIPAYEALTIASMIEGEAKFDADRAKVARVIYNRLAAKVPLGIDASSVYAAELDGTKPGDITFQEDNPYNTRLVPGLPPTPISNPGDAALSAAVHPADGNWTYYVNGDAQGHLYFTASAADFQKAAERCRVNKWGCT